MRTIQAKWESYRDNVLPKGCHENQIIETQRAFYAGAYVMLNMMSYDISAESEAAAVEIIKGLHREARQFMEQVGIST